MNLDLQRFTGDWYVIAHIAPFVSDDAYNAVERYRLRGDEVEVLYTFNEGSFDGELKSYTPTGFPDRGDSDGEWGMRFVWPFKAQYKVAFVDEGYEYTIVARDARDYVWLMSRSPLMSDQRYNEFVSRIAAMGYDVAELRRVPQQPLKERSVPETAKGL